MNNGGQTAAIFVLIQWYRIGIPEVEIGDDTVSPGTSIFIPIDEIDGVDSDADVVAITIQTDASSSEQSPGFVIVCGISHANGIYRNGITDACFHKYFGAIAGGTEPDVAINGDAVVIGIIGLITDACPVELRA